MNRSMMKMTECIKCNKEGKYHFGMQGEDTFDFSVCREHMYELWEFLGEEISLGEDED